MLWICFNFIYKELKLQMNIEEKIKIILNHFKVRNYDFVLSKTIELSKLNPNNSFLKNLLGSTYLNLNETKKAIENFKLSIKLQPDNTAAINNLANAFKANFEYSESEYWYLRALDLQPDYFNALMNYGNLKMSINKVNEAINLYNKAIKLNSKNHLIFFNLATAHQSIGNFPEAENNTKKCLDINPNFSPAEKLLSNYIVYNDKDNHFIELENKINNKEVSVNSKIYLHFTLAKAYADIKNFTKSFHHIELGNFLKNSTLNYDINLDIDLINEIKSTFKGFNFKKKKLIASNKKLIFIVGMPRSGTSLVEQIISSHSLVFAAGEIPFLRKSIFDILKNNNNDLKLLLSNHSDLQKIATDFCQKLSIFQNKDQFIIDKSLLNFLWIGFIKILFPNSKIIHIKRNPKDSCFSSYKHLFENGLQFTYNQENLGYYYNAYSDLMNFWNSELNSFILNINYEDLVDQPKNNIEKILDFCELNHEVNCFEHHTNKSPIKTMSALQARSKIYKSSINSYKNYELFLKTLFNILHKKKAL